MNNPQLFQQQMFNQALFQQQMGWKYFYFTFINALEGNKYFIQIEGNKTIKGFCISSDLKNIKDTFDINFSDW